MKLFDKFFNRLIDGNIKSLSESDKELLKGQLLTDTPKIWEGEITVEMLSQLKVGDVINDTANGKFWLVVQKYDDNDFVIVSAFNAVTGTIEVYNIYEDNNDVEWSEEDIKNLNSFLTKSEGARVWQIEDYFDLSEYKPEMKAGDIIVDTPDDYCGIIENISFTSNELSELAVIGMIGNRPSKLELIDGSIVGNILQVGTKLYKHVLTGTDLTQDHNAFTITIMSSTETAYTMNTIYSERDKIISVYINSGIAGDMHDIFARYFQVLSNKVSLDGYSVADSDYNGFEFDTFTDTVTPL